MEPIQKVSITDLVVSNLKELITSGEIPVDAKLPTEKEISEQLKVGRSTVREAFRVLQAMGFVSMKPGRGAFVAKTKEDDQDSIAHWFVEHELQLNDFMEVRMAIETLAVKLAVDRITEKEIKMLELLHTDFSKAMQENDYEKMALIDEAFHGTIAEATHNLLLITINKKVSGAFKAYRMKSFSVKGNAINALIPHRDIIQALKEKNVKRAVEAMTEHINISLGDVARVVEKHD